MKQSPQVVTLVLCAALCWGAYPARADADVVLDLTIEEMSTMATAVVYGRVLSVDAAWNDSHTRIFTDIELEVISYLGGQGPETVRIRQVGGRVGDTEIWVAGQPRFSVGEQVVVFLEPIESDESNRWVVLCMAAGLFRVQHDQLTGELVLQRNLHGVSRIPGPGRRNLIRQHVARPLLLRELAEQVTTARARGGVR